MKALLLVGLGGFLGSVGRYLLSGAFKQGTLAVNVIGCLLIGAIAGLAPSRPWISPDARLFLMTGVLGGFTTFSAFGLETYTLAREGDYLKALANVGLQLILGLTAVWLGFAAAQRL